MCSSPIKPTRACDCTLELARWQRPPFSVRNVLITAPCFHDGSQATLWDVVDHYNKGDRVSDPFLDQDIQPLALSESDIDDQVAFMASLTSADYRETRAQRIGASACDVPDQSSPVRHGQGLRAETAAAQAPRSHGHSRRNKVRGTLAVRAFVAP
jgi:hypothetical protein